MRFAKHQHAGQTCRERLKRHHKRPPTKKIEGGDHDRIPRHVDQDTLAIAEVIRRVIVGDGSQEVRVERVIMQHRGQVEAVEMYEGVTLQKIPGLIAGGFQAQTHVLAQREQDHPTDEEDADVATQGYYPSTRTLVNWERCRQPCAYGAPPERWPRSPKRRPLHVAGGRRRRRAA